MGQPMPESSGEGTPAPAPVRTFGGPPVPSGVYRVVLTVDGKEYVTTVRVENDPTLPPGQQAVGGSDAEAEEEQLGDLKRERNQPRRVLD